MLSSLFRALSSPEGSPNTAHEKNVPGPNSWEGGMQEILGVGQTARVGQPLRTR